MISNEERKRRIDEMMQAELEHGEIQLWYLSFASPEKFLGGCFVLALGVGTAIQQSHRLGINPGGSVQAIRTDAKAAHSLDAKWMNVLLTKQQLQELDQEMTAKYDRIAQDQELPQEPKT